MQDTTSSLWAPRRVGIIGAGAMGTSLAAIIGRALPTVIVCRNPDRAAELFRHGARTRGKIEAHSNPIIVSSIDNLAGIGGVSVLFVATKTTAIPEVARELKPLLRKVSDHEDGLYVVSYQNGIEPGRQLMDLLEWPRVLRMVLNYGAAMRPATPPSSANGSAPAPARDSTVDVGMLSPPHFIGTINPEAAPACEQIAAALTEAGFATRYEPNIERVVWAKGVVNAAVNPVAALVNSKIGDVLDSPAGRIVEALLKEGAAVASAEGRDLGEDYIPRTIEMLRASAGHIPSMVEDIRSGSESEVGQLNRQVITHAQRLGVPVPTHDIIDALIETFDWKIYEGRRP